MQQLKARWIESKNEIYQMLEEEIEVLFEFETDFIANAANFCSLLYHSLPDLNWAGFYLKREDHLVLGPFQGRPACVRIPVGQEVCGTAAMEMRTIIVTNVHQFPGHIACDKASRSEIVVPVITNHDLRGVLDLDSPVESRFQDEDKKGLESLIEKFISLTDIAF